jgi:hypothetical protein
MNEAYLRSAKGKEGDECYTPYYAVEPLLKYVPQDYVIWCPFDKEWSAYVRLFESKGYKVIYSHLEEGQDFLQYEPAEHYDIIISNPPYSIKDAVVARLYQLQKPFMMLMPVSTIQGQKRFQYFMRGVQLLVFDKRVGFHTRSMRETTESPHFGSAYFCKDILPNDLIFETLTKYQQEVK